MFISYKSDIPTPSNSNPITQCETRTPEVPPKKLQKVKTSETPCATSMAKMEEKQRRGAALESSKLMAARLLENKVFPSSQSNSALHNHAQSKPMQLNMQPNVTSSTIIQPFIHTANQHSNTTHAQLYTPQNTIPQVTESLQQTNLVGYNTENIYDWNYFGSNYNSSASEYFANSLSTEVAPPTTDCSKCLPYINALDQRVKYLEEKVEALASALSSSSNSIQTSHQTSKPFTHSPCSQTLAQVADTLETPAVHEQNSQQTAGTEVRDNLKTAILAFQKFLWWFIFAAEYHARQTGIAITCSCMDFSSIKCGLMI